MTSVVWPLPPGKLAAVMSVSSWMAIGALVNAGSFWRPAIRPLLRASAREGAVVRRGEDEVVDDGRVAERPSARASGPTGPSPWPGPARASRRCRRRVRVAAADLLAPLRREVRHRHVDDAVGDRHVRLDATEDPGVDENVEGTASAGASRAGRRRRGRCGRRPSSSRSAGRFGGVHRVDVAHLAAAEHESPAAALRVDRRELHVPVVEVVGDGLEVPLELAGPGVERHVLSL